jgi:TatD DNase family protein
VKLVDFHCHLDLYPDPAAVIAETDAAGIYTLAVTTTPRAWLQNLKFTANAKKIRVALGLHPQLVADCAHEIELWEHHLPETRYVGEVGLDAGPRFYRSLDLQKQVFERILTRCADAGGKILSIHSVRSAKTVLDMIETHLPPSRGRVVLHWFTGSKSEACRAVDLGCYFSVNLAMLSNERTTAVVAELPADRLLTETDGPFTHVAGRPAQPRDIGAVIDEMAALRSVHPLNMGDTVLANLGTLCGE